ncbi:MAG: hypothetical protein KTR35_12935 [Gammaproteobacteria bacterium]|nr:hypothetical protein [Gammaproteobacteria bacterium]
MNVSFTTSLFRTKKANPRSVTDLQPAMAQLSGFHAIRVSGEDAAEFLQSQFTNQMANMSVGDCQLTGYCNPKGRALAVMWLLKTSSEYILLLPEDLAETLSKRLMMFKMRAKVDIKPDACHQIFGVIDPSGKHLSLKDSCEIWPIDAKRAFASSVAGSGEMNPNENTVQVFDHDYWKLAQILAGEPMIYTSTYEALIPQHMNLDLVNGVSFTKGCYPGQEIVARLRYLGKLKQRMITGYCESQAEIGPGTPVFTKEKGDQKAGIVVDAVKLGDQTAVSVNIPATHIENGNIAIGSTTGTPLDRIQAPYPITLEKNA